MECVKLCNFWKTKHVLTFKKAPERGKEKLKKWQMLFKVETFSFKIKKKTFRYDHFWRSYTYLKSCKILHKFTYALILAASVYIYRVLQKCRIRSVPFDREWESKKKCLILFFDPMNNFAAINYCNQSISAELQEKARSGAREVSEGCGATATAPMLSYQTERKCLRFIYLFYSTSFWYE